MAINGGIGLNKVSFKSYTISSDTDTPEIDLMGGTLCGLHLESDITSTTFTIQVSRESGGTYVTVKDPESSGATKSYGIAATATGYYPINPQDTAGFRYCKIIFGSSETTTIYITKRSME